MRGRPELRDRFVGTLLIVLGATIIAGFGSAFAALGDLAPFSVTLLAGISVMFWGFLRASTPVSAPAARTAVGRSLTARPDAYRTTSQTRTSRLIRPSAGREACAYRPARGRRDAAGRHGGNAVEDARADHDIAAPSDRKESPLVSRNASATRCSRRRPRWRSVAGLFAGLAPLASRASSHREAPLIAADPQIDNTDLYAFVSPDGPTP